MTQRIEPIFSETQIEHFWSIELNILFEHDSQNWTLFEDVLTPRSKTFVTREMELFFNLNQRIKRFFNCCSKMMDPFLNMTHRNFSAFSLQRSGFSSNIWCKIQRIEPSVSQMSRRLELSFRNMSQRIKLFFFEKWLEELVFWNNRGTFFDDSKNWTTFLKHDSKNRTTFFFLNMTQRTDLFQYDSQN